MGYDGDDWLDGGGCDDDVMGGGGDDRVAGGAVDDRLDGHGDRNGRGPVDGNDQILGDAGDDGLFGGEGDDSIHAGAGSDPVFGSAGDGDDVITAALTDANPGGRSFLHGDRGDDTISAGAKDWAEGGTGAVDFIVGGPDRPALRPGEDIPVIADFDPRQDQLMVLHHSGKGLIDVLHAGDGSATVSADGVEVAKFLHARGFNPGHFRLEIEGRLAG